MNVVLLAHTPDAEKVIAAAAKLCYSASEPETLFEGLTDEKVAKFIQKLASMGHGSPLEHASFTFGISGVSRVLTHQLVRHRLASYSQQSQRYVALKESFKFIEPDSMKLDPALSSEFEKSVYKSYASYIDISEKLTKIYIEQGMKKSDAEKKAIEDARYVLPSACTSNIIVTMNARELMNFFTLRCCNRAQWEIRDLANEMLRLVKEVCPNVFKYAGPDCVRGACGEGAMSCGKPLAKIQK